MTYDTQTQDTKSTYHAAFAFAWQYWRRRPWTGIAIVALMTIATVIDIFVPPVSGAIVDALSSYAPTDSQGLHLALVNLALLMGLFTGFFVFRTICLMLWNVYASRNMHEIGTESMACVQRFSTQWHTNAFAGATVRKITRGIWAFDTFGDTLLINILPSFLILVGVSVMLGILLPVVGLFTGVMVCIYLAVTFWLTIYIERPLYDKSAKADTKVGAHLADIITGNAIVKAFGMERREEERFARTSNWWRLRARKSWNTGMICNFATSMLRVLMVGGMVGLTIWLWTQGRATSGDLVVATSSFFLISAYLWNVGQSINNLQRSVSEMEDIVRFQRYGEPLADAPNAVPFRPGAGDIRLERVHFGYLKGRAPLFEDLALHINPGEKVALVGASGSGKTTLIKIIQRLYDVTGGSVLIDGQDVRAVTQSSLRAAIALVPQDPALFHRSIAGNIAYGRKGATRAEVIEAAHKAYAHDFIVTLPQGYDTLVGERGIKLSGGERQRIAIARAILADCRILILDEATSSLDSLSEVAIQQALSALMEGRTCITVAHRLSTVRAADRILVMEAGRVIEEGTHESLLAHVHSTYAKLHAAQVFYG